MSEPLPELIGRLEAAIKSLENGKLPSVQDLKNDVSKALADNNLNTQSTDLLKNMVELLDTLAAQLQDFEKTLLEKE